MCVSMCVCVWVKEISCECIDLQCIAFYGVCSLAEVGGLTA